MWPLWPELPQEMYYQNTQWLPEQKRVRNRLNEIKQQFQRVQLLREHRRSGDGWWYDEGMAQNLNFKYFPGRPAWVDTHLKNRLPIPHTFVIHTYTKPTKCHLCHKVKVCKLTIYKFDWKLVHSFLLECSSKDYSVRIAAIMFTKNVQKKWPGTAPASCRTRQTWTGPWTPETRDPSPSARRTPGTPASWHWTP